jgi:hypothetical protein
VFAVLEFDSEGRIVRDVTYYDQVAFLAQMGMLEP